MVCAEFTLRNARCAISDFAARFLWLNPPVCHGHIPATGSDLPLPSAPVACVPRTYYIELIQCSRFIDGRDTKRYGGSVDIILELGW